MALLLREDSGRYMMLTARLWMATSLPSDVSEAAIHTLYNIGLFQSFSSLELGCSTKGIWLPSGLCFFYVLEVMTIRIFTIM